MGYKIRIRIFLNKENQENEEDYYDYQIIEKFHKDYSFDLDTIKDFIKDEEDGEKLINFFKKEFNCENDIFSLINEKPRARISNLFSLQIELPFNAKKEVLIRPSNRTTVEKKSYHEYLKFKQKKYFYISFTKKLKMELYLARYEKFRPEIQETQELIDFEEIHQKKKKKKKESNKKKHISESESESENKIFYNHNNVLCSMTFEDYNFQVEANDIDNFQKKLKSKKQIDLKKTNLIQCNVCYDKIKTYGLINCGHIYCFNCISNWSKQTNDCPLCKVKFNVIKKIDGDNKEFIKVEDSNIQVEDYIDPAMFANDHCYACGDDCREELLLICEFCFTECCHTYCLNPSLESVPEEIWYCDYCVRNRELNVKLPVVGIFEEGYGKDGEVGKDLEIEEVKKDLEIEEVKKDLEIEEDKKDLEIEEDKKDLEIEEDKKDLKIEEVKKDLEIEEVNINSEENDLKFKEHGIDMKCEEEKKNDLKINEGDINLKREDFIDSKIEERDINLNIENEFENNKKILNCNGLNVKSIKIEENLIEKNKMEIEICEVQNKFNNYKVQNEKDENIKKDDNLEIIYKNENIRKNGSEDEKKMKIY